MVYERVEYAKTKGNRTRLPLAPKDKIKTQMCRSVKEGVPCRFSYTCTFAHDPSELRVRKVNPKHKSAPCREYNSLTTDDFICYHSTICSYMHLPLDMEKLQEELFKNYAKLCSMEAAPSFTEEANELYSYVEGMYESQTPYKGHTRSYSGTYSVDLLDTTGDSGLDETIRTPLSTPSRYSGPQYSTCP